MKQFVLSFLMILSTFVCYADDVEDKIVVLCEKENNKDLRAYLESLPDDLKFYYSGILALDGFFESAECDAKLANFYFLKAIEITENKNIKAKAYKALADSFYSGDGIDTSVELARVYYEKAAKLDLPSAMFNLAVVYKELEENDKAIYWVKRYINSKEAEIKDYAKQMLKEWQDEAHS